MKPFKSCLASFVLPLFLLAGSCTNDPEDSGNPSGAAKGYGAFQISLIAPTDISQGFSSALGQLYDGPTPSVLAWTEAAKSGSCRLLKPSAPFCETPCGSQATCVANNVCKDFPKAISVGKVTVTGVKTKAGATTFTMDPLLNNYQPPSGVILDFPPFAEGDAVKLSAAGDASGGAFSVSAEGIGPLTLLNDSLVLADGKAIALKWTPPAKAGDATVFVMIDISHHGGTKGKIECEGPDNGTLEIPAALVDGLKALGVSGFPKIEVARRAVGKNANVDLILQSQVTMSLEIPGLISCGDDVDCPDGKTCQPDLQCK